MYQITIYMKIKLHLSLFNKFFYQEYNFFIKVLSLLQNFIKKFDL